MHDYWQHTNVFFFMNIRDDPLMYRNILLIEQLDFSEYESTGYYKWNDHTPFSNVGEIKRKKKQQKCKINQRNLFRHSPLSLFFSYHFRVGVNASNKNVDAKAATYGFNETEWDKTRKRHTTRDESLCKKKRIKKKWRRRRRWNNTI